MLSPATVSSQMRRSAEVIEANPDPRLARLFTARILLAMESAPETLRSPNYEPYQPPASDMDWDFYIETVDDMLDLMNEYKKIGRHPEGGHLPHVLKHVSELLKELAENMEEDDESMDVEFDD